MANWPSSTGFGSTEKVASEKLEGSAAASSAAAASASTVDDEASSALASSSGASPTSLFPASLLGIAAPSVAAVEAVELPHPFTKSSAATSHLVKSVALHPIAHRERDQTDERTLILIMRSLNTFFALEHHPRAPFCQLPRARLQTRVGGERFTATR